MVEIIPFLLAMALPLGFLVWTLRFKGLLSLITVAPLLLLNVSVAMLNNGATESNPPELSYNHTIGGCVPINSTVQCGFTYATDHWAIPFLYMTMINAGIGLFTLVTLFVVWRRVTRNVEPSDGDQ